MLLGTGVDIVKLSRIASLLQRYSPERLSRRILSDVEVCSMHQEPALRNAALQPLFRGLDLTSDVCYLKGNVVERRLVQFIGTR